MPKKVKSGGMKMKVDPETILIIVLLIVLIALVIVYVVTNNKNKSPTSSAATARFTNLKRRREGFQTESPNNVNKLKKQFNFLNNNTFNVYLVYSMNCSHSRDVVVPEHNPNNNGKSVLKDIVDRLYSNNKQIDGDNNYNKEVQGNVEVEVPNKVSDKDTTSVNVVFKKLLVDDVTGDDGNVTFSVPDDDKKTLERLAHHIDGVPTLLIEIKHVENGAITHHVFDKKITSNGEAQHPDYWIKEIISNSLSRLQAYRR